MPVGTRQRGDPDTDPEPPTSPPVIILGKRARDHSSSPSPGLRQRGDEDPDDDPPDAPPVIILSTRHDSEPDPSPEPEPDTNPPAPPIIILPRQASRAPRATGSTASGEARTPGAVSGPAFPASNKESAQTRNIAFDDPPRYHLRERKRPRIPPASALDRGAAGGSHVDGGRRTRKAGSSSRGLEGGTDGAEMGPGLADMGLQHDGYVDGAD